MNEDAYYDPMFEWRIKAYEQFLAWSQEGKRINYGPAFKGITLLAQLLGYSCEAECKRRMNEADVETIKALIGPHGWAIYKLLLIRNGGEETKQDQHQALTSDGNRVR